MAHVDSRTLFQGPFRQCFPATGCSLTRANPQMITTIRAPSLADLIEQLQENTASARTLWQAHSVEALTRRPAPARWSAR
jgi:hypothetical protein